MVSVDDPDPDLSLAPEFSPPDPNPHQALVISRYRYSLLISKIQFLTILVENVNFFTRHRKPICCYFINLLDDFDFLPLSVKFPTTATSHIRYCMICQKNFAQVQYFLCENQCSGSGSVTFRLPGSLSAKKNLRIRPFLQNRYHVKNFIIKSLTYVYFFPLVTRSIYLPT